MPLEEKDHILIEKYLLEQLSETERQNFDARLADPEFQTEVGLQRDLLGAFQAEGRDDLKAQLGELENRIQSEQAHPPSRRTISLRPWLAAASVAVLLLAAFWLFNRGPSPEKQFAQYFEPYPNVVAPISKGTSEQDARVLAFQTYELRNYTEAARLLAALPQQDDATYFYRGLSALALDQTETALAHLFKIPDSSPFQTASQWYTALIYIKSDQATQAHPLLETVAADASVPGLQQKAKALLESL